MDSTFDFAGADLGVQTNVNIANSFAVEVKAAVFLEVDSIETLRAFALSDYVARGLPYIIISGGGNVLFCGDYDGVVLHPTAKTIEVVEESPLNIKVRVGAGLEWDELVAWAVENDLWGLENLSLIPGYVGAAPIQNIGAYGAEAKDCIVEVETFDMDSHNIKVYNNAQCEFGYRESIFKNKLKASAVVTSVVFELSKTPNPRLGYGDLEREVELRGGATLANIREAVIAIRRSKLPDTAELGNAGSFFKNPVVPEAVANELLERYPDMPTYPSALAGYTKLAAGWLIDTAGLKGLRQGNVGVHSKQALVLVNYGGASGKEIITFAEQIRATVKQQFGIDLDFEVNIIK